MGRISSQRHQSRLGVRFYRNALITTDYDRDTWEQIVVASFNSDGSAYSGDVCYMGQWIGGWNSVVPQVIEAMNAVDAAIIRKETPPVSCFSDMVIDLHHDYWGPAVRAVYEDKSIVIDCNLRIVDRNGTITYDRDPRFHYNYPIPEEKVKLLRDWILKHKNDIIENHLICAKGEISVNPIDPS